MATLLEFSGDRCGRRDRRKKREIQLSAGRESRSHHPASGDSGAASVDGRRRSLTWGGKGEPHHRRHPPLEFSLFRDVKKATKDGSLRRLQCARYVRINQNRLLGWNNTSGEAVRWDRRAGAPVTVSGSAEQENGQGFQSSLRPRINSENRRVISTGSIPAAQC